MPALMTPPAARQLAARSVAGELAARLGLDPAELAEIELATDGRGTTFATDVPTGRSAATRSPRPSSTPTM